MDDDTARKLLELTGQVMMTFGRMRRFTHVNDLNAVHPGTEFAILENIFRYNCKTVPAIASFRGSSRQSVQRIVNKMIESDVLRYVENPGHRSSKHLQITDRGLAIYQKVESDMLERYRNASAKLQKADVEAAARVMAVVAETWSDQSDSDVFDRG